MLVTKAHSLVYQKQTWLSIMVTSCVSVPIVIAWEQLTSKIRQMYIILLFLLVRLSLKVWEGMLYTKKKNGDNIPQNVKITPVISAGG